MAEAKDDNSLGGADPVALNRIAHQGTRPDADNDPVPWDPQWMTAFDGWADHASSKNGMVLLFSNEPMVLGEARNGQKLHAILGHLHLAPGAYLVGRARTSHAWQLSIPDIDIDAICSYIDKDPDLRSLPTVVIGRRRNCMYFYPAGLASDGSDGIEVDLTLKKEELSWVNLDEQLSVFDKVHLNSQEMHKLVWANAAKWYPVEDAEFRIHSGLTIALRMVFRRHTIATECNLPSGRVDLLILSRDIADTSRAVLELKVLRSFSHTGATKYEERNWHDGLHEGISQAVNYAAESGATIKALCAFDMRKDATQNSILKARKECSVNSVELRDYRVFNSVRKSRLRSLPAKDQ